MSFKTDMLKHLSDMKDKTNVELGVYISVGKNPLDVTYDTAKFKYSLECVAHYSDIVDKLDDDDAVCTVEMNKSIIAELRSRVESRKDMALLDDGDDGVIEKKAEVNAWISTCEDIAIATSYMSSESARRLILKN